MRTVKYTELQMISTAWDKLEQNARFVMRFLCSTQLLSPSFHSVEMLMDSPYYLKYSLQQMAELYLQFIKLIVSGIFKLLFHVVI